jgi:hypothetical protein
MMSSSLMNNYRATLVSRRCLLLPEGVGRISGGVWIHGACTRVGVMAHTISGLLSSIDVRLVPAQRTKWDAPCDPALLVAAIEQVSDATTQSPRGWVVQLPQDRRRRRFSLLLLDNDRRPFSFMKFTANSLNEKATALHRQFSRRPPSTFWAPGFQASGDDGSWYFLALATMPNLPHGPARLSAASRRNVLAEIQATGEVDGDPTLVPVHGDFGPWNVRRLANRRLAVVDWEELTSGPIAADELWHSVTWWSQRTAPPSTVSKVLTELRLTPPADIGAAARYWVGRLSQPEGAEIDRDVVMAPRLAAYADRLRKCLEALVLIA